MGDLNPRPRGREEDELALSYKSSCVYLQKFVYIYTLKTCWLVLHFISEMYKLKNTYRVHLFLFNLELKVVFGFSLSY
jgi:hypothetical protein